MCKVVTNLVLILSLVCLLALSQAQTTTTTTNSTNGTSPNITFNEKTTDRAINKYNNRIYWEQRLIDDVLEGYDARTLPFIPNPNKTLNTTFVPLTIQFEIFGVNSIDIIEGTCSVQAAIREWWYDTTMQWDPKKYQGVSTFKMPTHPDTDGHSWVPDLVIREDAGEGLLSNTKYTDLVVKATGAIYNEI